MAAYTYEKINWENEPSYNTPINETNLNHMDQAIFDLAYVKAEKEDAVFVNSISLERKAGTTVGHYSVAAGYDTEASGLSSVAIGTNTSAKNGQAFAGGNNSKALGNTSFAFGTNCITRLNSFESLALGNHCIAGSANQMVFGQYNVEDTTGTYAEIVGNGSSGNESNARTLDWQGNETIAGDFTNGNGETLHGIYEALPVDTESGNPAVITDAFGGSCKSLKLTLEPIQSGSGTPSPQNVRPISGRTQSVVTRTGKNVYDKNATDKTQNRFLVPDTGETTYSANWSISGYIKTEEGLSYVLSGMNNLSTSNYTVAFYDANKTFIRGVASRNMNFTIPSGEGVEYIRFDYKNADENVIQLEVDSTATPYEPYNAQTITRTYGQTVYGAEDRVTGDGATVVKNVIDLGSLNWNIVSATTGMVASSTTIPNAVNPVNNAMVAEMSCSHFEFLPYYKDGVPGHDANSTDNSIAIWASGEYGYPANCVYIRSSMFANMTAEQVKAALSGVQVLYKLATPTSIPLTAQNITLLHGDNVLTTDADSIEASYSADIALYIEKKIAEGVNNRSLSRGGVSEEDPKEEEKKEEEEIEEPKKEETR